VASQIGLTWSQTQSCRCTQNTLHANQTDLLRLTKDIRSFGRAGCMSVGDDCGISGMTCGLTWKVIWGLLHPNYNKAGDQSKCESMIPPLKDNEVLFTYTAIQDISVMNSAFLFLKQMQLSNHLASLPSYMKSKALICLGLYVSIQVHFIL